jgi:hypothetical protein
MIIDEEKEQISESNNQINKNIILDSNNNEKKLIKKQKDLATRTKINKQLDINNFFKKSRHYFIMTEGGKPIYSRYGNEVENCGILATFSAIMTKFTFFNTKNNLSEKVQ